ncbi:hypothetical protein [Haloarchaeobius sp. DT45]|uniref:hypothetical protein n=1 Tax=Haloarchaeobius sp. DT45 TaxID=3446116 RepID=UPI003F6CE72E
MSNWRRETRRHGMTVARDGVVVEKRLDVQTMPLPAVSFDIVSERVEPVEVTLVEQLPADLSVDRVGFHPGFGADDWTCYGDGELVWRSRLAPGEHVQTVFGVWLGTAERALSLLTSPTVEAIREVCEGTDPLVLDESFVATPDAGPTDLKRAVETVVPEEALRAGSGLPQWSDLPDAGTDLSAPSRAEVGDVVTAITSATDVSSHDRYYHLRLSVETAGRGDREVSVLEDLTNALSVLYADANDRDDGAWRVLDVAIGTNWQAERIVTALGDDHRVSGLLVTELTGAVTSDDQHRHQSVDPATGAAESGPVATEFASSVLFGDGDLETDSDRGETADDGTLVDSPVTASPGADTTAEDFGAGAVDDFGGFEPAESVADGDASTHGDDDSSASDGFDAFEQATVKETSEATGDELPDEVTADASGATTGDDDGPDDSMAMFAELQAETEQASVSDLDAELEDVVLSPSEEEEYSIADLLDDFDEEENTASPA